MSIFPLFLILVLKHTYLSFGTSLMLGKLFVNILDISCNKLYGNNEISYIFQTFGEVISKTGKTHVIQCITLLTRKYVGEPKNSRNC